MLDKSGDGRLTYKELKEGFEKIIGKSISDVELERISTDLKKIYVIHVFFCFFGIFYVPSLDFHIFFLKGARESTFICATLAI